MSSEPPIVNLSSQQISWLKEFCRQQELESEFGKDHFSVEFQTDDVTVGIYPLADPGMLLLSAEIVDLNKDGALKNIELLLLLHQLNGLNLADSDDVLTIEESTLIVSRRVRLGETPPTCGADLIAEALDRIESVRALVKAICDSEDLSEADSNNSEPGQETVNPVFG